MIRLTRIDGEEVWVSPELVRLISSHPDDREVTAVSMAKDQYANVTESPQEVARKVLEYKLAMVRYSTGYAEALEHHGDPQWIFDNAELELSTLAGLEDTNDATP